MRYVLDMGYKSYQTDCPVPELITAAITKGVNFIGI